MKDFKNFIIIILSITICVLIYYIPKKKVELSNNLTKKDGSFTTKVIIDNTLPPKVYHMTKIKTIVKFDAVRLKDTIYKSKDPKFDYDIISKFDTMFNTDNYINIKTLSKIKIYSDSLLSESTLLIFRQQLTLHTSIIKERGEYSALVKCDAPYIDIHQIDSHLRIKQKRFGIGPQINLSLSGMQVGIGIHYSIFQI